MTDQQKCDVCGRTVAVNENGGRGRLFAWHAAMMPPYGRRRCPGSDTPLPASDLPTDRAPRMKAHRLLDEWFESRGNCDKWKEFDQAVDEAFDIEYERQRTKGTGK